MQHMVPDAGASKVDVEVCEGARRGHEAVLLHAGLRRALRRRPHALRPVQRARRARRRHQRRQAASNPPLHPLTNALIVLFIRTMRIDFISHI